MQRTATGLPLSWPLLADAPRLCAATASCVKIFDLESKSIVDELKPDFTSTGKNAKAPEAISLAWSGASLSLVAALILLSGRCHSVRRLHR